MNNSVMYSTTKFLVCVLLLFSCTVKHPTNQKGNPKDTAANSSLLNILNNFRIVNRYDLSYTIGFAGSTSQQIVGYKKLLKIRDTSKLIEALYIEKNPVAKLYLYQALVFKKVTLPKDIITSLTNDSTKVAFLEGCIGGMGSVKELIHRKSNVFRRL